MKKIGVIGLVLVMALGGLGVAFAHWQGTLDISGTVTAGTFGAELTQDNGWISSAIDDELVGPESCVQYPPYLGWEDPLKTQNIGSATCSVADIKDDISGDNDDTMTITITDAYPCYYVWVPVDVHCTGTVPIKVWYTMDSVPAADVVSVTVIDDPVTTSPDVDLTGADSEANAIKLHDCETARALIEIHCIQPDPGAGITGVSPGTQYSFDITVHYRQAQ